MQIIDVSNSEHYLWGNRCDGWHFLKRDDLSVILERVPPGEGEGKHFHNHSRQFFFILEGEAAIEVDGKMFFLRKQQGIEIPPQVPHLFRNESSVEVVFLVVSVPKSHGDRVEV
jgi:mannose-6-phosphate isomerase-like protein (cupin superfamily)